MNILSFFSQTYLHFRGIDNNKISHKSTLYSMLQYVKRVATPKLLKDF